MIERTEGNPLFLTELLRSLEEERLIERIARGASAQAIAQTPVPLLLRQIVDDRLSRLSDETAALLTIAAVAGQEVPLAVWGAVAGTDEEILLAAAERAEAAHLVTASARGDGIRFTHALIRDVLYEDVPALRRAGSSPGGGGVIALPAPDPDAVAYHLQQAGDERAAAWLVRAGERAGGCLRAGDGGRALRGRDELLDTQEADLAERGWVRLLAAALRRHDDRDRAFRMGGGGGAAGRRGEDPSLGARAQALLGLLLGYGGDFRTAVATISTAADMVDRLPPGTGAARRREQRIDKVANRGTLIAILARRTPRRGAHARVNYLAKMTDPASTPGELGAIGDVQRTFDGLRVAGRAGMARRSYAASVAAYLASDLHLFALMRKREELILAVLPYQADDLAERELVAAAAERTARWVVEHGGHVNPNLPRYAGSRCWCWKGDGARRARFSRNKIYRTFPYLAGVRPLYLGMLARAQGDAETAWRCVHETAQIRAAERARRAGGSNAGPVPALCGEARARRRGPRLHVDGSTCTGGGWTSWRRRWDASRARSSRPSGTAPRAKPTEPWTTLSRRWRTRPPRGSRSLLAAHRILGILAADAGRTSDAEHHFAEALALADACRAPYERALTLLARADLAVAQATARRPGAAR